MPGHEIGLHGLKQHLTVVEVKEAILAFVGLVFVKVAQLHCLRVLVEPVWRRLSLDGFNCGSVLVEFRSLCQREVVDVLLVFELHLQRFLLVAVVSVPRLADDLLNLLQIKVGPFESVPLMERIAGLSSDSAMGHLISAVHFVDGTVLDKLFFHLISLAENWLLSVVLDGSVLVWMLEVSGLSVSHWQIDVLVGDIVGTSATHEHRLTLLVLIITQIEACLGV